MHCINTEDYDKSKNFLTRAMKVLPCNLSFKALGMCYNQMDQLDNAEICLRNAINFDFDDCESWMMLNKIYTSQGRTECAKLCNF